MNDCSTRKAAVIPDSVMQPFMRIAGTDPSRIRFLVNPLTHYAEGNTLVEIMTGPLAGLQGYIIRIDRDRKLVIGVGDMTVAIGGVHKENFEKSKKSRAPSTSGNAPGDKRNNDACAKGLRSMSMPTWRPSLRTRAS